MCGMCRDHVITKGTGLPWPAVAEVMHCLLGAIRDLRNLSVAHLDLKPANMLYFVGQGWRVTDLGLALALRDGPRTLQSGLR